MVVPALLLIYLGLLLKASTTCVATRDCCNTGFPWFEGTCSDFEMTSAKSSSAVMLYQPMPFLEPFHKERRSFKLSGHQVEIHQKWTELGVAAVVWDAAIVLSEYLEKEATAGRLSLTGKKIIELGAGTGLLTMAMALLGGEVISTDRKEALSILQENVEGNFKEELSHLRKLVTIRELSWGDNLAEFPEKFDLILGADIVYVEKTFEQLLDTIRHLSHGSSRVLLSCRIRYDRDLRFLDLLRNSFTVSRILRDELRGIDIYEALGKR